MFLIQFQNMNRMSIIYDSLALGTGIVIAVPLHEVDHTPHSQTGTKGNNECLKDRNLSSNMYRKNGNAFPLFVINK